MPLEGDALVARSSAWKRGNAPSGSVATSEGSHLGSTGAAPSPNLKSCSATALACTWLAGWTPSELSLACNAVSACWFEVGEHPGLAGTPIAPCAAKRLGLWPGGDSKMGQGLAHGALCSVDRNYTRKTNGSAVGKLCTRSECETRAMETLALVQARSASVM